MLYFHYAMALGTTIKVSPFSRDYTHSVHFPFVTNATFLNQIIMTTAKQKNGLNNGELNGLSFTSTARVISMLKGD